VIDLTIDAVIMFLKSGIDDAMNTSSVRGRCGVVCERFYNLRELVKVQPTVNLSIQDKRLSLISIRVQLP
jgi:hypothetical protein